MRTMTNYGIIQRSRKRWKKFWGGLRQKEIGQKVILMEERNYKMKRREKELEDIQLSRRKMFIMRTL